MNLLDLTAHEITQINKEEAVLLLPLGSVEQHGPHLPIGTKCYLSETLAYETANRLKNEEIPHLICPTVPFMPCNTSIGFEGCYFINPRTYSDIIYELAVSFYAQGFKFITLINLSISPEAIKAIQTAIEDLSKFEDLTVIDPLPLWNFNKNEKLTILLKKHGITLSNEFHAGVTETSALMSIDRELIREEIAQQLPPCIVNKTWEVIKGHFSFKEMGSELGYLGTPSKATPELGRHYIDSAVSALYRAIASIRQGKELPELPLQIRMLLKMIDLDEM